MSKIFFYSNVNFNDKSSGITKKVQAQIATFRKLGYQVLYTGYTEGGVAIYNDDDEIVRRENHDTSTKRYRILRRWYLLDLSIDFLEDTNIEFEFGYLRFHFFDSKYVKLLKVLKEKKSKVVVEVHSYPYRVKRLYHYTPIHVQDFLYERFARKYIDVAAAITNEKNVWGVKTVNIDNAIDLHSIEIQNKVPALDNQIRMISVTNENKYHGFDKIIKGLDKYYQNNGQVDFQIFFVGKYLNDTINLAKELNLTKHIHFTGSKHGEELIEIYNQSDLGIGALGNRANAEYGSTIKTKEYFGVGLPFINGWKEYSFDDSYPYVHRMELSDKNVDFFEVEKFYNSIEDDKSIPNKMRSFARDNFSWDVQMKKIINAL